MDFLISKEENSIIKSKLESKNCFRLNRDNFTPKFLTLIDDEVRTILISTFALDLIVDDLKNPYSRVWLNHFIPEIDSKTGKVGSLNGIPVFDTSDLGFPLMLNGEIILISENSFCQILLKV